MKDLAEREKKNAWLIAGWVLDTFIASSANPA